MPEGPLGAPRLTNFGPLSRQTEEEVREKWSGCPDGYEGKICEEIKVVSLAILEDQGFFAWYEDLVDINSGECATVAGKVAERLDKVTVISVLSGDHTWVKYNGKHFDAERPTGVEDPFSLPFFQRFPPGTVLRNSKMEAEALDKEIPETRYDMLETFDREEMRLDLQGCGVGFREQDTDET